MEQVTITATMQDGSTIVEQAGDFGAFVDTVLSFRRDRADVARLRWTVTGPPRLVAADLTPQGGMVRHWAVSLPCGHSREVITADEREGTHDEQLQRSSAGACGACEYASQWN